MNREEERPFDQIALAHFAEAGTLDELLREQTDVVPQVVARVRGALRPDLLGAKRGGRKIVEFAPHPRAVAEAVACEHAIGAERALGELRVRTEDAAEPGDALELAPVERGATKVVAADRPHQVEIDEAADAQKLEQSFRLVPAIR